MIKKYRPIFTRISLNLENSTPSWMCKDRNVESLLPTIIYGTMNMASSRNFLFQTDSFL